MKKLLKYQTISLLFLIWGCGPQSGMQSVVYPEKSYEINSEVAQDLSKKIRQSTNVTLDGDLELSLWAADTLVRDPIAISIDESGKIYYTSATRQSNSEFDIRGHANWMTASISFQTVEDRRAFLKKTFNTTNEEGEKFLKDLNEDGILDWRDLAIEKEQVWIVADTDGDGVAEKSSLYLEDFNEEITDVANGVEVTPDAVYISVGPDLWKTIDQNQDGRADQKESLSHGYAVHIGFSGHGMSGVTKGPDGRIWWGIGDIGANIVDRTGKNWKYPNRGVVARSEPDGSGFEIFAFGVRNTHEFTFDKYGNLITEDNDGDHSGERERLVYLLNGSETGWRINWQFGKYTDPKNNSYKVWMDEKMHIPHWDGQAAYFLPPIMNYVNGPTGFVYNPGTALGPEWEDHFFVAEFRGTPANSPIHAFTMREKGAGFELDQTKEIVKGLLPTGLDFGPDGALYFGDWIDGWDTKDAGRIWKLDVPEEKRSPLRATTQKWIQTDFSTLSNEDLVNLLSYKDMRIRTKAQFALAAPERAEGLEYLIQVALNTQADQLARIHGIWGTGQITRKGQQQKFEPLIQLLSDKDPEIVAQTARQIGDINFENCGCDAQLIELLKSPLPRIQLFATEALGRIHSTSGLGPIVEMLRKNNNQDLWLRHAGMVALARLNQPDQLTALVNDPSAAVRIAAVVALRRLEHPGIAAFLADSDEAVVTEAARGINDDFSIEEALPALANILNTTPFTNEALIRRAINANSRVGVNDNVDQLLTYAQNTQAPEVLRAEAIATLTYWGSPSVFDRVDGRYRGEVNRDDSYVTQQLGAVALQLMSDEGADLVAATADAAGQLNFEGMDEVLLSLLQTHASEKVRTAALTALGTLESSLLDQALTAAIEDQESNVRALALSILPQSNIASEEAITLFRKILTNGTFIEKQSVIQSLATLSNEPALIILNELADQLLADKLDPKIQLDLVEALEQQEETEEIVSKLSTYQSSKDASDPIAAYRETLEGGRVNRGRNIFYRNQAAQCVRCHAVFEYGGNAGPGLAGVADRLSKEDMLISLIEPSAEYAPGYGVVILELADGGNISGIVMKESDSSIQLQIGKEDLRTIQKSEISSRENIPSSMPSMKEILSKREIRDVIAFLTTLEGEE
ncbi:MAG: hypothetical protein RLZZ248_1355 [Bacteroidota bacterium]